MHPFIIKDKPGTCPICAMELIKKIDTAPANGTAQTPEQKQQAEMLGHVSMSAISGSWQMLPRSRPREYT